MKKIFSIFLFLFSSVLFAESMEINSTEASEETEELISATRSDIRVIEASEHIIYISQDLVKNYLYLSVNTQNTTIKKKLESSLVELNNNLKIIARTTKNDDTKDLLEYLAYSKDEISETLNQPMGEEQNSLMLDYSESLLEGANSMVDAHQYTFTKEEEMLMVAKRTEYLLARIMKYYMAKNLGFDTIENQEKMENSIVSIEKNFAKINLYDYPRNIEDLRYKMNKSWEANKVYFLQKQELFIPNLMLNAVNYLESIVGTLMLFHSKNQ